MEWNRCSLSAESALGHRGGDNLLFEHYRTLTSPEAAAEFWQIAPARDAGAIRFPVPARRRGSA